MCSLVRASGGTAQAFAVLLSFSAVSALLAATPTRAAAQQEPAAPGAVPAPAAPAPQTPAPEAPEKKSQVVMQATWDEFFVYLFFQVDDSDVTGTNSRPMSKPEEDDSVTVYFHTGPVRPDAPTPQSNMMAISAAGGFTFKRGDAAQKAFVPHPLFTVKFGVAQQGSLNRNDDRDKGYTTAIAIPITELGLDPKTLKPGTEVAFNAIVRTRGEDAGFTSLSSGVTSEADMVSPAKWGKLVFAAPDAAPDTKGDTVIAPQLLKDKKPPLIDGAYRDEDWPAASRIAFAAPDKPKALVAIKPTVAPVNAADAVAPPLKVGAALKGLEKRLMARYVMNYQGDTRKLTAPLRGIIGPGGTIGLPEQPISGVGPWFTYERTAWHRAQLTEMRRSGIDVALTQVGGPDAEFGSSDEKGLLVLVSALKELAQERIAAPQVALYLDTTALMPKADLAKLDLTKTGDRELLYESIRRWMNAIPAEFRARVTLPGEAVDGKLVSAYPVFLSDASVFEGANSDGWVDDLRTRFAKEFGTATGGTTLLLVGGKGFDASQAKLAGTLATDKGGVSNAGTGLLSTFVLRPGRDDANAPLVPRKNGATYKEQWEAALAANADWIVIDSWNDFTTGTQIASSRQYGSQYVDQTRIYAAQANGLTEKALRWLATDAPRRIRPGQVVNTTVTVQNASATTLRSEDGIRLVYRWLQDGKEVARSLVQVPLASPLLPTRSARIPMGIAALKAQGDGTLASLPAGEYVLQIDMAKFEESITKDKQTVLGAPDYFSTTNDSSALRLPVTITSDLPESIQFDGSSTPPLLLAGGTYPVTLRLRWLGEQKLPADAANIVYQLLGDDGKPVTTGTIPLAKALQPGQWENVIAILRLTEAGAPVPVACPEPEVRENARSKQGTGYKLRWLLARTQSTDTIPGEYVEQVAVYPQDDQARIEVSGKAPTTIAADSQLPIQVTLINRGSQKWVKGTYSVAYHWYQPDGIEVLWMPPLTTPLTKDIAPGEQVTLPVLVRAPDRSGEYLLTFDMFRAPDVFLSTHPVTPTGDIGLVPIRITDDKQKFLDLSKQFDVDAISTEGKPTDGDFDGKGATLPAESFPPDAFGIAAMLAPNTNKRSRGDDPLYPSGYFSDISISARQTWFSFGSKEDGKKNAVACKGQVLNTAGRFFGLHLAAAATGSKDVAAVFTLTYKDGSTEKISRTIGDWNRRPGASDPIAVSASRKRTPQEDIRSFAGIRHVIIPVDVSRELVSVTLPNDPNIKVFAVTLER
jgi:hypothetical protein